MININEYFGGSVKSLTLESAEGKATVGVIKPGEYEFGTSSVEIMTVVSGSMDVLLPEEKNWITCKKFESFTVTSGVKFKVRCTCDTPYFCLYK